MAEGICKTLYSYNGAGGGEITTLTFDAGEAIQILYSGDEGWWEGEINGRRGWFPASYVTKVQESEVSSTTSDEWNEVKTPTGEIYYVNTRTNKSSWELPDGISSGDEATKPNATGPPGLTLELTPDYKDSKENIKPNSKPILSSSEPTTPQQNKLTIQLTAQSNSQPTTPMPKSPSPNLSSPRPTTPNTPQSNGHSPKPQIRIHNGISYPTDKEAKEQSLLQPGKFSYCDYFWSDRVENHSFQSGFYVLYQKMLAGKQMCKEMSDLFKAREALEVQYAKGLTSIANSMHAAQEGGTLGETWKQVKEAALQEAKLHQEFANKLRSEVERPLQDQKEEAKKDLKKLSAGMSDIRKQVHIKYQGAERAKQLLLERGRDLEMKMNSPKHTKEDVNKAKKKSIKQAEELTHAVEAYNQTRQHWFEEMVTSSLVLERHEVARIESVKSVLAHYAKLLQDSATKRHQTCDVIVQHLAITDADKDRELWVRKNATGKVKPVDLVV
uniref:Growth arrest-specific protein 7 n=1 Tax=Phallusia mammillata TaxID=59560 RepID=A0A6F9DE33_9ASCI|nr:growth arrest-specific protein 7 [Phallusia mammillata]